MGHLNGTSGMLCDYGELGTLFFYIDLRSLGLELIMMFLYVLDSFFFLPILLVPTRLYSPNFWLLQQFFFIRNE